MEENGEINEKEKILECLYDKTYVCPSCDVSFKNRSVKKGKVHLVTTEIDLKPIYEPVNIMLYSVVSCPNCGYTALDTSFDKIGVKQSVEMKKALEGKFVSREFPEIYDTNSGIIRYKMALICAGIKKAKKSEFGYIALRLSWLYSDIGKKDKEMEFTKFAYEYYKQAYSEEKFPIYGADEDTAGYIIAILAYKLGDYEEALKWLASVIISRTVNARLKEKAIDLKDTIRIEREKQQQPKQESEQE